MVIDSCHNSMRKNERKLVEKNQHNNSTPCQAATLWGRVLRLRGRVLQLMGPSSPADEAQFSGGRVLRGADFSGADFSAGPTSPDSMLTHPVTGEIQTHSWAGTQDLNCAHVVRKRPTNRTTYEQNIVLMFWYAVGTAVINNMLEIHDNIPNIKARNCNSSQT